MKMMQVMVMKSNKQNVRNAKKSMTYTIQNARTASTKGEVTPNKKPRGEHF